MRGWTSSHVKQNLNCFPVFSLNCLSHNICQKSWVGGEGTLAPLASLLYIYTLAVMLRHFIVWSVYFHYWAGDFCKAIEEDAHERAERRKEREKLGREWKRKGTQAFRKQEFQAAVDNYSQAIEQCPWDISLYTNLALVSLTWKIW